MYDSIINTLCLIAVLYIIYQSYLEYKRDLEFKQEFITDHNDLENKLNDCKNSQLYDIFQNLSDDDKKFLDIYINYARIKQKNNKPKYNKIYNGIKNQIIFSTIISLMLKKNPSNIIPSLKQNTFTQFSSHFL